ncbi:MAG: transaldolase / glucose-6-phosphate isomerase [Acidimicrobiaceae bacterium]|nr:transaldolase / glucose-6-phosphate isomerase [Acidimicrobiaceae bacterium]
MSRVVGPSESAGSGGVVGRLWARDHSLWPAGNVSPTRLGWLDVAERMRAEAADLRAWADSIDAAHIVLLGMGGSSLGPEVLRATVNDQRLFVCDTTDPETVASIDPHDTFFLVSSKSGTTLEVKTLFAYFWDRVRDGSRFAAITDPGTAMDEVAVDAGFNRVFRNPADIGGRYSVLSYFGLVPAALMGLDVEQMCTRAIDVDRDAAAELGVAMGQASLEGRDKVNVVVPEDFAAFGLWVEQLIAESTGKQGKGCIPVPSTEVEHGPDRHVVALELNDVYDLGEQFMRWEVATAVAGHVLGIDPFDEPNVTESKNNTGDVLDNLPLPPMESADPGRVDEWLRATVRAGDYVSVQAYLPYGQDTALEHVRRALRDGLDGTAVTAGYGPRFLHSTGQLHKGGPDSVVALQLVRRTPAPAVPIPGHPYDFNTLIAAQAIGDHRSLEAHGRRVLRVALDDLKELG